MPNTFAYIALAFFPIISLLLYLKCNAITATFWTIVGGYIFLPVKVAFDFPLVPPLGQQSIPAISAIFGCYIIKRKKIQFLPQDGFEKILVIALLIVPIITVLTNTEPFFKSDDLKPGLGLKDIFSSTIQVYLEIAPFLLGLSLVQSHRDQQQFIKLMVIAGLIYSPLVLFEIRFSPQLHSAIYGFFPHEFKQQVRMDGFRAVVFIGHGLLVSILYVAVFLCSIHLARQKVKVFNVPAIIYALYFSVVLVLCKSVGAWVLSILGLCFLIVGPRFSTKMASYLSLVVLLYPLLCLFKLFPHDALLTMLSVFGEERIASLDFRFFHENMVLEHTREKLAFGWGGWGRNRPEGVVTDGYWIIRLSEFGLIGFACTFLIILSPVLRARKLINLTKYRVERTEIAFAALFTALMAVNQIPNSSMYSWLWFSIGVMAGGIRRAGVYKKSAIEDLKRTSNTELNAKYRPAREDEILAANSHIQLRISRQNLL